MSLTENQRLVLRAICDGVFHSHTGNEAAEMAEAVPLGAPQYQQEKVDFLIRANFTDLPGSVDILLEQYRNAFSKQNYDQLMLTLSLLSTRAGTFLLTGHLTPFYLLTIEERENVVKAWSTSKILLRRKAYRGFASIAIFVAYTHFDDCSLATGYPALGDPLRGLDPVRVRSHHPYKFESIATPFQVIEIDVLVIGSGAGGGVVSSYLSQKGWRTLVVEKGTYVKPEDMAGTPKEALKTLYESKGLMATEDGGINLLAGSCFGGGTTVNWSASLLTPSHIREDWAKRHGLSYFLSPQFTASLDFVRSRMGVSSDAIKHSRPNELFVEASTKLGYHIDKMPQNTNHNQHSCGFCSFGCTSCEKQGGTVTWLKDAAEAGTRFLVETNVERLLFASSSSSPAPTEKTFHNFTPSSSRRRCVGALVKTDDGKYAIIRAREAVVLSAGAINSPAILLKSGLKNSRIGKNLKLHPTSMVTGYYKSPINPWDGSIMTAVSTVKENRDGSHHGCKIEVNMSFPGGTAASFQPWRGSRQHKEKMLQFNNSFTLICISRDRGSGEVFLDKEGIARINYALDPYDGESILEAVISACEIHLMAGASCISTTQLAVEDYHPVEGHQFLVDPLWLEWIGRVREAGIKTMWSSIACAHQMGSNQMGTNPKKSVVDPRGRVWGTEGLYVADASVFPTASGVNPMVTIMAISHSISQFVDQDLNSAASKQTRSHL